MKLPKALLGAILAGVAITALNSCDKKRTEIVPDKMTTTDVIQPQLGAEPYSCPACGMG